MNSQSRLKRILSQEPRKGALVRSPDSPRMQDLAKIKSDSARRQAIAAVVASAR